MKINNFEIKDIKFDSEFNKDGGHMVHCFNYVLVNNEFTVIYPLWYSGKNKEDYLDWLEEGQWINAEDLEDWIDEVEYKEIQDEYIIAA